MVLVRNLMAFSYGGKYLAYSSPDGGLKIWETATGILKQEYTPSSHLSATCSSLSWGPSADKKRTKRLKNSCAEAYTEVLNSRLIAMGTMTGDILLYSFKNADLFSHLSNGHSGVVNDLAWYCGTLYSCSDDQHIIVWDIVENCIKMKWRANIGPIYSICVINDNNILSASNSIQWWNIKEKTVLKTFNGHGSEIFKLIPLNVEDNHDYFMSAAVDDRVMNVWQLSEDCYSNDSVVSFVLPDTPANIDILPQLNEPLQMSVITQDGSFHFFKHSVTKRQKKPLLPTFTIQIATKFKEVQKAQSLPILAASISSGIDLTLLAYGSFLKPIFETINISDVTKDTFLLRSVTGLSYLSVAISKIKQAQKPNNVKLLGPGYMADSGFSNSTSKKRRKIGLDINELPIELRLKALDLSKTPNKDLDDEVGVKSESMIHLLLQGLQSKDNIILNAVLNCSNEVVIDNTIRRLPIQCIFPLLDVLYKRLYKIQHRCQPNIKWLIALFSIHLPYFASNPDVSRHIDLFDDFINGRRNTVYQLSKAKGILKILMMQANSMSLNSNDASAKPLFEYASESSEESDAENDSSNNDFDVEVAQSSSDSSSQRASDSSESSDSESEMEVV